MRLNQSVASIINDQINNELDAHYIYLGMAAYFDAEDLSGFARWFRAHSQEEYGHAMRLYDFLVSCDVKVSLRDLKAPSSDFKSPEHVIEAALAHEQQVTDQIKNIFRVAHEAQEYTTQPMLHWFLTEQIEEEELFRTTLNRVKAAETRFDLLSLDAELGVRDDSHEAE